MPHPWTKEGQQPGGMKRGIELRRKAEGIGSSWRLGNLAKIGKKIVRLRGSCS